MTIVWNSARVEDGLTATRAARPAAMAALRELLADYGQQLGDERYLDLIAGNWLDQFLHVTYVAHEEILAGGSRTQSVPLHIDSDLVAYVQSTITPAFHAVLRATVGALLENDGPAARRVAVGGVSISGTSAGLKKRIATGLLGSPHPAVLFCNPYPKCSMAAWGSALWSWRRWARWDDLDIPLGLEIQIDAEWRRTRSVEAGPVTDYDSLVRVLMPLQIPAALLEGLDKIRSKVLKARVWRPKVAYTANALHGHLPFKVLAAEWCKEGTKLVSHQHGSGYGLDRQHTLEDYETNVADRFYSWGWQRPGRAVSPLSPAYSALRRRPSRGILLVCCSFPTTAYRLHFHPMPGTLEAVDRNTAELLCGLPSHTDLMIRLNPANNGLRAQVKWQLLAPQATFDDLRENVFRRFEQYGLVLHNYIGTTFLEALAYDIPTVAFYDVTTYAYRAEAQPLVETLERVGILHRSGSAAAAFVAGLAGNVAGWWHGVEVQEARNKFVSRYANFSYNWKFAWEQELSRLAG
jgi:hypothetical protein